MKHLEVCLPSCIKSLSLVCSFNAAAIRNTSFLCSFNAAATWNTAAIKILSLFIVGLIIFFILLMVEESVAYGRIHNLSLFWQRFWKHMHTGFSNLICCLSGHFLQVRLIIQHCFFLSGLICLWFRALLFSVTYGSTNTQEKLTRTNKQKNL